ncbi:MAG: cytochrome c3 family protein [Planctomycetota bacterium]|jgi:predicted CXXCH cytochrome family protein
MRASRRTLAPALLAAVLAASGCSDPAPESPTPPPTNPVVRQASLPPAPRPIEPLPPDASCTTTECHATFETSRSVHGVLRTGRRCLNCHEPDQGGHVYPVRRPGNAGCVFCHETMIEQRIHQHGATEVACLACHDPHASDHRSLVRTDSIATLCAQCHPAEGHSVAHAPVANGECVSCHDPHESDFPALLRGGAGNEHCARCHETVLDGLAAAEFVHPPARQDCLACHQAHGSEHPHLLNESIEDACFACHADIEKAIAGVEVPHGAVSTQARCGNCHDAHASPHAGLLKDRQDVLCLSCHDRAVVAQDGRTIPNMAPSVRDRAFLHGPVRSGECTACHSVHGGTHARLLRANFTEDFYSSFDVKHYALCFECHERELVTAERTTALTNFRNGDLNLHYLHVNRQKGRTCRTCHEMHGSDQPSGIATEVPFEGSGWALPIEFRATDNGGSCSPGCHKPMGYDRVTPIPPTAVPKEDSP